MSRASHLGRTILITSSKQSQQKNWTSNKWPSGWQGLVIHGGGERAWNSKHPVVQHLLDNYCAKGVYTMELPTHGQCASDKFVSPLEARQSIRDMATPILQDPKTIVIAYSIGARLLQLCWKELYNVCQNHPISIFLGTLATGMPSNELLIKAFWLKLSFKLRGAVTTMKRIHTGPKNIEDAQSKSRKKYWELTVDSCYSWIFDEFNSASICYEENMDFLLHSDRTYWINGNYDLPYPHKHFSSIIRNKLSVEELARRSYAVNCTHFGYFTSKWQVTRNIIDNILQNNKPHT